MNMSCGRINIFIVSSLRDFPLLETLLESLLLTSCSKIASIVIVSDALPTHGMRHSLISNYSFDRAFEILQVNRLFVQKASQYTHQMSIELHADKIFTDSRPIFP